MQPRNVLVGLIVAVGCNFENAERDLAAQRAELEELRELGVETARRVR